MALLADYYHDTDVGDDANSGAFGDPKETRDGACDQIVVDSGGTLDKNVTVHGSGVANDTAPWTTAGIAHGGFQLTFTSDAVGSVWNASKYSQLAMATYTTMGTVDAATGDVIINHLQIDLNIKNNSKGIISRNGSIVDGAFVKNGTGSNSVGVDCYNTTSVRNSIVSGCGDGYKIENWAGGITLYNNISANCINGIQRVLTNGTDPIVENHISFNNTDDFLGQFGTIDYCASDDNDGTNNVAESSADTWWTSDFNDAANDDFTLLGTSNLDSAGVDLSGIFTNDINDDTRTKWSVGPDDNIAPPVGGPPVGSLSLMGAGV